MNAVIELITGLARILVVTLLLPVAVRAETGPAYSGLIAAAKKLSDGKPLTVGGGATPYKGLYDTCDRTNTFNGSALPTHNGRHLTCSSEKNNVDYLVTLPGGVVSFAAKAAVDADGSKFACGAGWPNQCGTWLTFDRGSTNNDVNAEDTPFVVVPSAFAGTNFQGDTGILAGDLAVAFTDNACAFGVVGDAGPGFRLGELSLRAHKELGHDRCLVAGEYPCKAIRDVGLSGGVHYLIFPHSRPVPLTSDNVNDVSKTTLENSQIPALLDRLK